MSHSYAPYSYAIALGSNRRHGRHGSPAGVLRAAIGVLEELGLTVTAISRIMSTPALGPAGRAFANAAILADTPLDPPALLALLKRTERAFGRRRGKRWGPRVLDLDIILWSAGTYKSRHLSIPHRETPKRAFVLAPLAMVAPRWRLGPGTVAHALARLDRARPRQ